jgi:uncharacterized protein involved in exopolysaccharide biosynthesis
LSTRAEELNESGEVDLNLALRRLWQKRYWVIASTILFAAAFAAACFMMTPIYRAAVVLAPANTDRSALGGGVGSALSQLGGLAAIAGVSVGGTGTETDEAIAVLKSREFTENFINDKKLISELFAGKWDAAKGQWRVPESERPTPAKAYKYFDKKVRTILQDKKTGLVTLQVDWRDRVAAADWANELVQRLNSEMRRRAIERSEGSVEYLEKELATTPTVATREAINRLIETQVKQRMFANVSREYVFRVVDRALPADPDDIERPKKVTMISLGALLGLGVGVIGALMSAGYSKN